MSFRCILLFVRYLWETASKGLTTCRQPAKIFSLRISPEQALKQMDDQTLNVHLSTLCNALTDDVDDVILVRRIVPNAVTPSTKTIFSAPLIFYCRTSAARRTSRCTFVPLYKHRRFSLFLYTISTLKMSFVLYTLKTEASRGGIFRGERARIRRRGFPTPWERKRKWLRRSRD